MRDDEPFKQDNSDGEAEMIMRTIRELDEGSRKDILAYAAECADDQRVLEMTLRQLRGE